MAGREFLIAANGFREGWLGIRIVETGVQALLKFLREQESLRQGKSHSFLTNLLRRHGY